MLTNILNRLQKVRKLTANRYIARCPAHQDGRPSLSLSENDDKVLLHCFAGCHPTDILEAVGLSFDDLFAEPLPSRGDDHDSHEITPQDVFMELTSGLTFAYGLDAVRNDATMIWLIVGKMLDGNRRATPQEFAQLTECKDNIAQIHDATLASKKYNDLMKKPFNQQ